jgi:hypothetical protein
MKPSDSERRGRVEIRVKNVSDRDFDRVRAHFPEGEVDYGPVPKAGVTTFRSTGRAYRFAGFSVKAGDRELLLQPLDYLGEQELPAGRYTFALDLDNGALVARLLPGAT